MEFPYRRRPAEGWRVEAGLKGLAGDWGSMGGESGCWCWFHGFPEWPWYHSSQQPPVLCELKGKAQRCPLWIFQTYFQGQIRTQWHRVPQPRGLQALPLPIGRSHLPPRLQISQSPQAVRGQSQDPSGSWPPTYFCQDSTSRDFYDWWNLSLVNWPTHVEPLKCEQSGFLQEKTSAEMGGRGSG